MIESLKAFMPDARVSHAPHHCHAVGDHLDPFFPCLSKSSLLNR